ncbi:MAG: oligopeptide:H+ symporter [Acidobacteriota bacterium]|nr:oligopeptide:H+ symporter [Acidobacteriota bacterium]
MSVAAENIGAKSDRGFFGHPWGLSTLFFTEMWERFSYYGMRAILFLYMTAKITDGGLGWTEKDAGPIFGLYAASVYFLPLIGGWLADRFIGAKRATLIGGVVIMLGHFALAVPTLAFFYIGLVLVAVGTGFLKSNISAMVGHLYSPEDVRRDAGFSVFYMGINIGAFASPLVCGYLAQSESFKTIISGWGISPESSWHFGFAAAGVGMFLGLIQYVLGARNLKGIGEPPIEYFAESETKNPTDSTYLAQMIGLVAATIAALILLGFVGGSIFSGLPTANDNVVNIFGLGLNISLILKYFLMPVVVIAGLTAVLLTGMQDQLTADDWKRIGVIMILFTFSTMFWMGFEQASTSLNAFADKLTITSIGGWDFAPSYLQAVNPLLIIIFAPIIGFVWLTLGKRQPADSIKFAIGLFFGGLGFVVVAYASSRLGANPETETASKVTFWWLVLVYLCHTIGELCLSPVGLSSMTKLAPKKMVSLMLGVWFLSVSLGNYIAGQVAGEFVPDSAILTGIFTKVAMFMIGAGIVLALISPLVKKLYTKPEEVVPTEPA